MFSGQATAFPDVPGTIVFTGELCRKAGYAISREEHSLGVIGVAMALDDDHSLSVAIPSPRFDAAAERRTVEALRKACVEIAAV